MLSMYSYAWRISVMQGIRLIVEEYKKNLHHDPTNVFVFYFPCINGQIRPLRTFIILFLSAKLDVIVNWALQTSYKLAFYKVNYKYEHIFHFSFFQTFVLKIGIAKVYMFIMGLILNGLATLLCS